jgi:hypothetical protein
MTAIMVGCGQRGFLNRTDRYLQIDHQKRSRRNPPDSVIPEIRSNRESPFAFLPTSLDASWHLLLPLRLLA